jgi:hypothetical protein
LDHELFTELQLVAGVPEDAIGDVTVQFGIDNQLEERSGTYIATVPKYVNDGMNLHWKVTVGDVSLEEPGASNLRRRSDVERIEKNLRFKLGYAVMHQAIYYQGEGLALNQYDRRLRNMALGLLGRVGVLGLSAILDFKYQIGRGDGLLDDITWISIYGTQLYDLAAKSADRNRYSKDNPERVVQADFGRRTAHKAHWNRLVRLEPNTLVRPVS